MTSARDLLVAMRPRQWAKNLFVLLPLLFGKHLFDAPHNLRALAGFAVFCAAASAVYLLNDVRDRAFDRKHRVKRLRPIASGRLSARAAIVAAAALLAVALPSAAAIGPGFLSTVLAYLALNALYAVLLKDIVILDVFSIGAFFLLRVQAGTFAAQVPFSRWMMLLALLLALFLGFTKRRQEIVIAGRSQAQEQRTVLSKYDILFIDQMISVCCSSIIVVYLLYAIDGETMARLGTPYLVFTVPFVYYGIFRYLYVLHRHPVTEDPTTALFSDRMMRLNLLMWAIACVLIVYRH